MSNRTTRRSCQALALAVSLAGLAVVGGCGRKQRTTVPFRGELNYQGKLDARQNYRFDLVFHLQNDPEPLPLNPGTTIPVPKGVVADNGAFQVSTYKPNDGLPEGTYKVTATLKRVKMQMGAEEPFGDDLLGKRYSDPKTTPLEVAVKKGMESVRLEVK